MIERDEVAAHEETLRALFADVLRMDFDQVLVTDGVELSDFRGRGMPDHLGCGLPAEARWALWDDWVCGEIKARYGVPLPTPYVELIRLAHAIEQAQARPAPGRQH